MTADGPIPGAASSSSWSSSWSSARASCSRLAWWQVVRHESWPPRRSARRRSGSTEPVRAGRSTTGAGRSSSRRSVDRYRLVAASPDQITPAERQRDRPDPGRGSWGWTAEPRARCPTRSTTDQAVRRPHPRARASTVADADPRGDRRRARSQAISLEPEPDRRLSRRPAAPPGPTLAAHLLGFVNRDGEGQYGVEERYQAELAGTARELLAERDVVGRPVTDTAQVVSPGRGRDGPAADDRHRPPARGGAGGPGRLHRRRARSACRPSSWTPYTGAIYAEASYPSYDANDYRTVAAEDPKSFVDPVVSLGLRARLGLQDVHGHGRPSRTARSTCRHRILDSGTLSLDPVRSGVVVVSRDLVAADVTGARLMGMDPEKVGLPDGGRPVPRPGALRADRAARRGSVAARRSGSGRRPDSSPLSPDESRAVMADGLRRARGPAGSSA